MLDLLKKFDLQRFAGPDDGGDPDAGDKGGNGDGDQPKPDKLTMTQADLDAIITKRLKREQKTWEEKLEEEKKKAQMTEAERLKTEKEAAENAAKTATEAANKRVITAEAKVQATALGVKAERLPYLLKLADLSEVAVDENGDADGKAVKEAVEKVLAVMPEFKGSSPMGTGSNPGGGGDKPPTGIEAGKELAKQRNEARNKQVKGW